ncbi:N-acetylmuramoyl-L-alanine amidase [Enterococcus sp.]|uniref:N-acetylmuramoyl-L-alanine amidase n=1 Tax=Enterococcus sp. TaxID=35783 RepID=UPI003C781EC4
MVAKKNGVEYRQNLVSPSMYGIKCPFAMKAKKASVHETDNNASANNEVAYMGRNGNQTSYHVAIDEKEAVQGIPFDRNAWHAGDGANGYGNRNTIGFEICKNYDPNKGTTKISGAQLTAYNKAKANAVKVIAAVMIEQGINGIVDNVKTHQDWSGKLCPQKMLREGLWIPMRDQIIAEWCRLKTGGTVSGLASNPKPLKDGKVGDTVKVYDSLYLTATGGGQSVKKRGQSGKIKRVYGNSKKYLIEDWGWAHANDIQLVKRGASGNASSPSNPATGTTKTVTIDVLNVYTGQKLSDKIVRSVKKGAKVKVTATANNGQEVHGSKHWSEIDKHGWVPSVYLK